MTIISYDGLKIKMIKSRIEFKDLANALKFSSHTITKLKRNEPVSFEVISKLCDFFHCNMDELVEMKYFDDNTSLEL